MAGRREIISFRLSKGRRPKMGQKGAFFKGLSIMSLKYKIIDGGLLIGYYFSTYLRPIKEFGMEKCVQKKFTITQDQKAFLDGPLEYHILYQICL